MFSTSSTSSPSTAPTPSATPGSALPRGLRAHFEAMSPDTLLAAASSGPVRLGQWECTDGAHPSSRLGPQARHYRATIAVGDHIATATAAASGPISALTAMLHDRGVPVEMHEFHQLPSDDGIATYVLGTDGWAQEWAMGLDQDATESALRAMIACANRLAARRA